MSRTLLSALKAGGVPALLAGRRPRRGLRPPRRDRPRGDPGRRRRPIPGFHPETRGYRFPDPDAYPLQDMPWIQSREDFIAFFTRGEDPAVVRRHVAGPEDELIEYLGEVFLRRGHPATRHLGREAGGPPEGDLAMRIPPTPPVSRLHPAE